MTITAHVTQFVTMKQNLGYRFTTNAKVLTSFARFAAEEDSFIPGPSWRGHRQRHHNPGA